MALAQVDFAPPAVPVLSCVTAQPFADAQVVRELLAEAIVRPVRWLGVMRALQERGIASFVETGPGRVLTRLVRKSLDGVEADAPVAEAPGA